MSPQQNTPRKPFAGRLAVLLLLVGTLSLTTGRAHHFKGLPHYNYYENYPQVPEEEFLGQVGDYEVSLVVYDFQGINRQMVEDRNDVRLYLVIFNLRNNDVYGGALTLEILDGDQVTHHETQPASQLENLYSLHRSLPDTGSYALRLTLHDEDNLQCTIPFALSSQKVHWGKWVALILFVLVTVAAVGARKARVKMDRKLEATSRATKPRAASPRREESTHPA